jgi:2-polyprenyl-3-methyl-5-hydroxy-6-metoxy-1,4-benzoquinol methylase
MNPALSEKEYLRNRRAHRNLSKIGFAHKIINHHVLMEIKHFKKKHRDLAILNDKTLDVGCGTGYLVQKLHHLEWDAQGVDPFPRGRATQRPLNRYILNGSIYDIRSGKYHIITGVEVLEHVENYSDLLIAMANLLHSDGQLIVTVPNSWEFAPITDRTGRIEPRYGHLWKFKRENLYNDLKLVFNFVRVKEIYSRDLDLKLLKLTRLMPPQVVIKLSQILVRRRHNGAWLLGIARGKKDILSNDRIAPLKPTAQYYKNDKLFCGR